MICDILTESVIEQLSKKNNLVGYWKILEPAMTKTVLSLYRSTEKKSQTAFRHLKYIEEYIFKKMI